MLDRAHTLRQLPSPLLRQHTALPNTTAPPWATHFGDHDHASTQPTTYTPIQTPPTPSQQTAPRTVASDTDTSPSTTRPPTTTPTTTFLPCLLLHPPLQPYDLLPRNTNSFHASLSFTTASTASLWTAAAQQRTSQASPILPRYCSGAVLQQQQRTTRAPSSLSDQRASTTSQHSTTALASMQQRSSPAARAS